jgi:hypothetical protein
MLSRFNPEKNIYVRSLLYAVGVGGALHLLTLLAIAIKEGDLIWFNPLFAVDVDKVFPSLKNNPLSFVGGWLLLLASMLVIKKLLQENKN